MDFLTSPKLNIVTVFLQGGMGFGNLKTHDYVQFSTILYAKCPLRAKYCGKYRE